MPFSSGQAPLLEQVWLIARINNAALELQLNADDFQAEGPRKQTILVSCMELMDLSGQNCI